MSTVQKHSVIQIFIILSSIALIVSDLTTGQESDGWNTAAMIIIGVELLAWLLIRKRTLKDPLERFHGILDVVCIVCICVTLLVKFVDLMSFEGTSMTPIVLGVACVFALCVIALVILGVIKRKN